MYRGLFLKARVLKKMAQINYRTEAPVASRKRHAAAAKLLKMIKIRPNLMNRVAKTVKAEALATVSRAESSKFE
jgi:hypothetical protein